MNKTTKVVLVVSGIALLTGVGILIYNKTRSKKRDNIRFNIID